MAELEGMAGAWGAVTVAPRCRRWNLRVAPADRAAAERAWGGPLPDTLLLGASGGGRSALHLEPDDWLLLADDLAAAHGLAAPGLPPLSLVEISDRQLGFVVTGSGARDLLAGGCPLDLADRAFPIGAATRTVFGKVEIVLWRQPDAGTAPGFRVEVWRSYAPYLLAHWRDIAAEL